MSSSASSRVSITSASDESYDSVVQTPVFEFDAAGHYIGFAGASRRYPEPPRRPRYPTLQSDAPPPYTRSDSVRDALGFAGLNSSYAEPLDDDDIVSTTHGEVIKAKLRYKLYKLRKGKEAEPWDVFLNKSLKRGEIPWAPLGAPMWKLPKSQVPIFAGVPFPSAQALQVPRARRSSF